MGLVRRTVGGCVAAVCALSLSGAAAVPVADRMARFVPDVASVTQVAGVSASQTPQQMIVTAEVHTGMVDDDPGLFGVGGDVAIATSAEPSAAQLAIPAGVLRAYQRAADRINRATPECGLRWEILAGIGKIESNHARGGQLDSDGDTVTPIVGPVLNGAGPIAAIRDTDDGRWDGDPVWDRAVGPMQFIPGTWRTYGVDGSGDGEANPHNVWDATLSAGEYLCAGGADLTTDAGLRSALLRYNRSTTYVTSVINWINAYADGSFQPTAGGATGGGSGAANSGSSGTRGSTGSSGSTTSPKPTKSASPTRTPTTSPSQTPKPTGSPSKTPSPSPSPSQTPSETPSETPSPSPDPSETPTPTPTPSETPSPSPTPDPSETPSPSPDPTEPDPDPTEPDPDPTETPAPDPDPSETPSPDPDPTEPEPDPTECPDEAGAADEGNVGDDGSCDDANGAATSGGSGAARSEND